MEAKKKLLRLLKLEEIIQNGDTAIAKFLFNLEDTLTEVYNNIDQIRKEKGEKGEDGHTPTPEELIELIKPLVPKVENGKTPTKAELLELIKPLVPQVKDGKTPTKSELLDLIVPLIPKEDEIIQRAVSHIQSKLVLPDIGALVDKLEKDLPSLGEPIRDALELLREENRIDVSAIKGIQELLEEKLKTSKEQVRVIATNKPLSEMIDVNVQGLQPNQSLKWNGREWIPYTPVTSETQDLQAVTDLGSVTTKDITANSFITDGGDNTEVVLGDGTLKPLAEIQTDISGLVPYTGATTDVDLGSNDLFVGGNVGIGTDGPSEKLDVGLTGTGSTRPVIRVSEFGDSNRYLTIASSEIVMHRQSASGVDLNIKTLGGASGDIVFEPLGVEKARITSDGLEVSGMGLFEDSVEVQDRLWVNHKTAGIGVSEPWVAPGTQSAFTIASPSNQAANLLFRVGDDDIVRILAVPGRGVIRASSGIPLQFSANDQSSSATDPHLFIATDGNLGIGTTSPESKLTVVATETARAMQIVGSPGGYTNIDLVGSRASGNLGGLRFGREGDERYFFEMNPQADRQATYFSTGNGITPTTPKLSLLQNGNFGIGTTSPQTKLHVEQTAQNNTREQIFRGTVSDAPNDQVFIGNGTIQNARFAPTFAGMMNSANNLWSLGFAGFVTSANDSSDSSNFGVVDFLAARSSSTSDPLNGTLSNLQNRKAFTFRGVGGLNYMTILSDGNVGIGTDSPLAKLSVMANSASFTPVTIGGNSDFVATLADNLNGISGVQMGNTSTGTSADFRFLIKDNTGHYFAFSQPGENNNGTIFGQPRKDVDAIFNAGGTARHIVIGTGSTKDLIFGTNNQEQMRILANGNLGIGTTSPTEKLEVDGNIISSGDIEASDLNKGVILKSPNGTRWRVQINDTGNLTTEEL